MSAPLHFEPAAGNPLCWFTAGIRVGTVLDPVGLEGFTRHTAELARRGAGGLERTALDDAIDRLGASIDLDVDRDWLAVSATCLERNLDRTVALAAAVLRDPLMSDKEHEVLRRETLHELDDVRDDDGSLVERHFQVRCAPGHSYGRTALGTAESLARLDRSAAAAHHQALWAPEHLVLGVAGPVTAVRAREVADQLAAAVAGRRGVPVPTLVAPPPPAGRRLYLIDKPERSQCQVMIGHLAPAYGSDDFIALMPLEAAFGGMFSSRLMQEIRVKRGWSYGASCRMLRSRAPHWFRMSLAPTREVTPDAIALSLELYERLVTDGLTAEELDLAVRHLTGSLLFTQATPRQRMRLAVRHHLIGLDPRHPYHARERLASLTLADVRAAAERWLHPRDLCIAIVATAADMAPRLEAAGLPPTEILPFDSF
jgi:zinc protease